MIAAGDADEAAAVGIPVVAHVFVQELADVAVAGAVEEAPPIAAAPRPVMAALAEQRGVAALAEVEQEVHVEARGQRFARLAPFRNQRGVGILRIQPRAHLAPEAGGLAATRVLLDERTGHVHPEAGRAPLQPEAHDILHRLAHRPRAGRVHRLLPGMAGLGVGEPVVECGLAGEEVDDEPTVALAQARDDPHAFRRRPDHVRPDEPVAVLVALVAGGGLEPGVLPGSVAGHQVQEDADAAAACLRKERLQVGVRAVAGRDLVVVADIVARILERGGEAGVQPQRVDAERLQVVQFRADARQVTDTIAVGIVKRLRVDFVEDGILEPGRVGPGRRDK